jgi:hypothetical protein
MGESQTWRRTGFTIATDPAATDLDVVCGFLAASYGARDVARVLLEKWVGGALV